MSIPFKPDSIRIVDESPVDWARRHPEFFFHDGKPTSRAIAQQLLVGAAALEIVAHAEEFDRWLLIGAEQDWFCRGRHRVDEALEFQQLPAFPEQGQNCVRPELLIAAFAEYAVIRDGSNVRVVKGAVAVDDPVLEYLQRATTWRRAIAFHTVGV